MTTFDFGGRRFWLQSGTNQLPAHRSSPLSARLLRAQRRFGNAGCSGRKVTDLKIINIELG